MGVFICALHVRKYEYINISACLYCAYVYKCEHVCVCVCVCVCLHISYMCDRISEHVHEFLCEFECIHFCAYICARVRISAYTRTCIFVDI